MELTLKRRMNVPALTAWTLLADRFGDIAALTTGLQNSWADQPVAKGTTRICVQPNGAKIIETMSAFSRDNMSFRYDITKGAPTWIKSAYNRIQIIPVDDNTCDVISTPHVDLPWWLGPLSPVMRIFVGHMGRRFFEEVEYFAIHGEAHPRVKNEAKAAVFGDPSVR